MSALSVNTEEGHTSEPRISAPGSPFRVGGLFMVIVSR